MRFFYSHRNLSRGAVFQQRFFEILPGLASWTLILGLVALSVWMPLVASIAVIAFMLAWVLRLFYLTIFLFLSYARLSIEKNTDWLARIRGMDRFDDYLSEIKKAPRGESLPGKISLGMHRRDLEQLKRSGPMPPRSAEIFHLVVIPVVKEASSVVEANVLSIASNTALARQMVVVLAVEARAEQAVKDGMARIADIYRDRFMAFLLEEHPDGLPGEARVKGANTG